MESPAKKSDGLYAGIAGGYLIDQSGQNWHITEDAVITRTGNDDSPKKHSNGPSLALFVGYEYMWPKNFYSAVEGKFTYYNNNTHQFDASSSITRLTYKHSSSLSLKLGQKFHENLIAYVKAGYSNARISFDGQADDFVLNKKIVTNKGGYELGFGISSEITNNIRAGLEITKSYYEKQKLTQSSAPNSSELFYKTVKPRLLNIELNLSYKF